jgi:hypothetical protein
MFSLHPCAVGSRHIRSKQISHGVEGRTHQPVTDFNDVRLGFLMGVSED